MMQISPMGHDSDSGGAAAAGPPEHGSARHVRVVELVRVAKALIGNEFLVFAAERMDVAGGEVRERHLVAAANLRILAMHLAGKAIRRQPLGHRVRIEERPVDAFWLGGEYTVQFDCIVGHGRLRIFIHSCLKDVRPGPDPTRDCRLFRWVDALAKPR